MFVGTITYFRSRFDLSTCNASASITIHRVTECLLCCHDFPHILAFDTLQQVRSSVHAWRIYLSMSSLRGRMLKWLSEGTLVTPAGAIDRVYRSVNPNMNQNTDSQSVWSVWLHSVHELSKLCASYKFVTLIEAFFKCGTWWAQRQYIWHIANDLSQWTTANLSETSFVQVGITVDSVKYLHGHHIY